MAGTVTQKSKSQTQGSLVFTGREELCFPNLCMYHGCLSVTKEEQRAF